MLAYNYPNGVDKIQLASDSNYVYSMSINKLLTGFLFRHVLIVVFRLVKSHVLPDPQPNHRNYLGNPYQGNFSSALR